MRIRLLQNYKGHLVGDEINVSLAKGMILIKKGVAIKDTMVKGGKTQ